MVRRLKEKVAHNEKGPYLYIHLGYSLYKRVKSKSITWVEYGRHHEARIDPFELLHVPTDEIKLVQQNSQEVRQYPYEISEVRGGDWDKQVEPFRNTLIYNSFYEHFVLNDDWEDTQWVKKMVEEIENEQVYHYGCKNEEEFLNRCGDIDVLYNEISENGFKTQKELMNQSKSHRLGRSWAYFCPNLHEITVNIDRHGNFIFEDGWNRFTISKVLGVNNIPVRVNIRHEIWQSYRDAVVIGSGVRNFESHPDLNNLCGGN